jgi:Flp pilus assembly protein TadB
VRNTIFSILFSIFLIIFIFSLPFPAILKKTKQVEVNNTLDSLEILIEEIENGISVLEAVARDGENFLEIKEKEISDLDLRAIFRITKLSTNYGVVLAPLLRSFQSELLAKKELKNLIGIEAGAAKATTHLLAVLPLLLLTLAQMTGLNVVNTFRNSIIAQVSLLLSITLQILGRFWAKRVINAIQ